MSGPCPMEIDIVPEVVPEFVIRRPSTKLSYPTLVRSRLSSLAKKIEHGPSEDMDKPTFAVQCLDVIRRFMQQLEHDEMLTASDIDFIRTTMLNVECAMYTHTFSFASSSLKKMMEIVNRRIIGYEVFARRLLNDEHVTKESLGDLHMLPGPARLTIATVVRKYV